MLNRTVGLAKDTFRIFLGNRAASRGAAIAFYTVTSIAPLLLLVVAIAGFAFGHEAARGAMMEQFRGLIGQNGADIAERAIAGAANKAEGVLASVISVVTLLVTASGIFLELEEALNAIWEVKPKKGIFHLARARIASLGLVIALGFLLMVSLVVDAALKGFSGVLDAYISFGAEILVAVTTLFSFVLTGLVFAAILKLLPAKPLSWRDVGWGAAVSALLFEIGKAAIGFYLGKSATISSLGAAGALLALLFWVYYTAQIFLLGAAFTRAYRVPPKPKAAS